jgi:hypothetical protein
MYTAQIANINRRIATKIAQKDRYSLSTDGISVAGTLFAAGTEEYEKYLEEYAQISADIANLYLESAELITERWGHLIKTELKSTFGDMDKMKEEWEWITSQRALEFDSLEKSLELQKLENEITKAVNNTANVKIREQLAQFRERELAALRSQVRLNEEDLKMTRAKFQVLQAEIALREAQ